MTLDQESQAAFRNLGRWVAIDYGYAASDAKLVMPAHALVELLGTTAGPVLRFQPLLAEL